MKNFDELVNKKMSITELSKILERSIPEWILKLDDYRYIKHGLATVFLEKGKHIDIIYKWNNTINEYKGILKKQRKGDETWADDAIVTVESVEYYEKDKGIYKRKSKRDANLIISENGNGAKNIKISIPVPFAKALRIYFR